MFNFALCQFLYISSRQGNSPQLGCLAWRKTFGQKNQGGTCKNMGYLRNSNIVTFKLASYDVSFGSTGFNPVYLFEGCQEEGQPSTGAMDQGYCQPLLV